MVVCIAIGNALRGDDGVARYALSLIPPSDQMRRMEVFQLTPELACEITAADVVFFLDADPSASEVALAPVETPLGNGSPLVHSMSPGELVAVARRLYAFAGQALLCRIPAKQFDLGEELSPEAKAAARSAASMIVEYAAYAARTDRTREGKINAKNSK